MKNRTWIFATITSLALFGFSFIAKTIGLPSGGFDLLALGLILGAAYQTFNAKMKKPQSPQFLPHRVNPNA